MITTSGGGALICRNAEEANEVMWYATQARDAYPYYQHTAIGYNYRMSNVCAGIGRGQMTVLDVQKANLTFRKQRKHTKSQTRKMTRRLLELLGKILKEIQQKNLFQGGDSRESIPDRIVSINKPYVRPIVRGKEVKSVEFGASPLIYKRLFGVDVKKIGRDTGYAGTENRNLHPFSSSTVSIQLT